MAYDAAFKEKSRLQRPYYNEIKNKNIKNNEIRIMRAPMAERNKRKIAFV